jgi:CRP-like cAMP-binding protein
LAGAHARDVAAGAAADDDQVESIRHEILRTEEDLIDQLFNSSEKRLARTLLLLARYGKSNQALTVPNVSQTVLAEMIGTTRSRVSNFTNKFRDLGFISYNGNIEVHSSLLNVLLNDRPQLRRDEAIDAE